MRFENFSNKNKSYKKLKSNIFFKIAFIIFIIFCTLTTVKLQMDYNSLKNRKEDLSLQKEILSEKISQLENTISLPFDDEYVIKIAKQKLNLRLPEEIVFFNDLTQ